MPHSQRITARQVPKLSSKPVACFDFPPDHHLLVTTPSCILAWDQAGLHKIFKSSKSSIAAAREPQDGSKMLAVADQRVVVLHDTRKGREDSWGLYADEDEVRLLEYAPDAKTLFLSTNSTCELQQYSMEKSRLMGPLRNHATPPIALALSPTGHIMLSASDNPPTLCLQPLSQDNKSIVIQPRASDAPVVVASFHPKRADIFLLGFRDGTLAAYDAKRLLNSAQRQGSGADRDHVYDGEIAHIDHVHRTTTKIVTKDSIGTKATSITAAAFLPGYNTRAICAGSDGRCRLVDFAEGGIVIRTWHVKAPVTSVSVLSVAPPWVKSARSLPKATGIKDVEKSSRSSINNIIALGRSDGKVHIYDTVGLLLAQRTVNQDAQRIISVDWVKGSSPRPIQKFDPDGVSNDRPTSLRATDSKIAKRDTTQMASEKRTVQQAQDVTATHHLGLPSGLLKPMNEVSGSNPLPQRKFTIHPDEVEEGSVRYTPHGDAVAARPGVPPNAFVDLFSPIKATTSAAPEIARIPVSNPPRTRPRISSLTFTKNGEPSSSPAKPLDTKQSGLAVLEPIVITDTDSVVAKVTQPHAQLAALKHPSTDVSPFSRNRRKSRKSLPGNGRMRQQDSANLPNENAKILANIRKLSSKQNTGSVLGPFAPKATIPELRQDHKLSRVVKRNHYLIKHKLSSPAHQKTWDPGNVLEREAAWVTDSNQDRSSDELEEDEEKDGGRPSARTLQGDIDGSADIWLTSADETASQHSHVRPRRRMKTLKAVDSSPRCIHPSKHHLPPASSVYSQPDHPQLDVSLEEDMLSARTHFSSTHGLSPSSKDINNLFPRTSSLSPGGKHTPRRRTLHQGLRVRKGLNEIHPNMVSSKSPWTRVKTSRAREVGLIDDASDPMAGLIRSPKVTCFDCVRKGSRVAALESEVTRLKAETLALKAVLRRHGLSLPAGLL